MVQPPALREGNKPMVNHETMNCEHVWKEISNYIEGDIAPASRAAMDDHFRTCQRCRSVLDGTRNVVRLYSDERMIDVPSGFGRRLEKRLSKTVRAQRPVWSTWYTWLIPIAALLLFVGGIRWASTRGHSQRPDQAQWVDKIPPDMKVVVSKGAKEFHVPGCEVIRNKEVRTLTARQAIDAGYVPCPKCMRKYLQAASNANATQETEARTEIDFDDERESRLR